MFKNFFLKQKRKNFFFKLKRNFYQRKIIKRQFITIYGKKNFKLRFLNNQSKFAFDTNFFNLLAHLELRLNILVSRMFIVFNLLEVNKKISNGLVLVNGVVVFNKNYLVRCLDIIELRRSKDCFFKKKRWLRLKNWRKFR